MKILVDTCVWSRAFRRSSNTDDPIATELKHLLKEFRAQLFGPIRQELLSGIRSTKQFADLGEKLSAFKDIDLETTDFEKAAEFSNICRLKGMQGSPIDFLICAISYRYDIPVFTTDKDFNIYKKHLPIKLHSPRAINDKDS